MNKPNRFFSADQVRQTLAKDIARLELTQSAYAEQIGVTGAFVNMVLKGKKAPSGKLLNNLGYESVNQPVKYRRIK